MLRRLERANQDDPESQGSPWRTQSPSPAPGWEDRAEAGAGSGSDSGPIAELELRAPRWCPSPGRKPAAPRDGGAAPGGSVGPASSPARQKRQCPLSSLQSVVRNEWLIRFKFSGPGNRGRTPPGSQLRPCHTLQGHTLLCPRTGNEHPSPALGTVSSLKAGNPVTSERWTWETEA